MINIKVLLMPSQNRNGKNKRRKNKSNKVRKLEDIAKDMNPKEFEVYAKVTKTLGNRRLEVRCQRLLVPNELANPIVCLVKNTFRRTIKIEDYVLVKLYDFNPKQGQVIDAYKDEEILALKEAKLWDYPQTSTDVISIATDMSMPAYDSDTSSSESDTEDKEQEQEQEKEQVNSLPTLPTDDEYEYDYDAI